MNEEAYRLVEAMKHEINRTGRLTAISPIMAYLKSVLQKNKLKVKKGAVVYRARIVTGGGFAGEEAQAFGAAVGEFRANAEKIAEEITEEDTEIIANKVSVEHDPTIIDLDEPQKKRAPLLFVSADEGTALADFKRLIVTDCIVDSIHIKKTKKLADFSKTIMEQKINGPSLMDEINHLISLYLSLYIRDLNSDFYNTGRYIIEYLRAAKFDGMAYLSRYNPRGVHYILFSFADIETVGSRGVKLNFANQIGAFAEEE